jgi:hypothetical protein
MGQLMRHRIPETCWQRGAESLMCDFTLLNRMGFTIKHQTPPVTVLAVAPIADPFS